jgi:GWxTD domain-containing protein
LKIYLLFTFVLVSQLLAQPDFTAEQNILQSGKYFNSEIHFFNAGQDYSVYYTYKISYSQLFFEKRNDQFDAGFSINLEIKDSSGNIIKRAFDERKIGVKDFDATNSLLTFLQGVVKFNLPAGDYNITALISDQISKRERRIPPVDLKISKAEVIHSPIVFEPEINICNKLESYILTNNSAAIPFNKPKNVLLIPVTNQDINSLSINIKRGDTVFVADLKISDSFTVNPELMLCDDKIVISKSTDTNNVKVFISYDFSSKLTEGPVQLEIYPDDKLSAKQKFILNVVWIGKPISLSDPEEAIKFLEIIETKDVVSDVLSGSGTDTENLNNYWHRLDPTPETEFNELMSEFYTRVDYCEMNFKSLSGNGGAKSDRGRIYIKYGPPDLIGRDTDSQDKVVESWTYKKSNRKFVFIDQDGTGKFTLANGQ